MPVSADILCPIRRGVRDHPQAPALLADGETWSYEDLERRVAGVAAQLKDVGCAGRRVALLLPSGVDLLVLCWALLRVRSTAVLLSTRVPSEQVPNRLCSCGAEHLVTDRALPDTVKALIREGGRQVHAPEAFQVDATGGEEGEARVSLDQAATILFTSGSTGSPKAALHTVGNHYYSALGSNRNITVEIGDRWLAVLPLYHVGGLGIVWRCWLAGAAVVVPTADASLVDALHRHRITHVSLVETQLRRLLRDEAAARPPSLRAVLLGGSAVSPVLVDATLDRGWPLHTTYGMTEMTSQVTTTPPGAPRAHLHSSGRVLPYRKVRIAEDGEILVRGKTLFAGYVASEEAVEPAVDGDGWYHTGDLGQFDDEALLYVTGRKDNLFISGGENIQPERIEAVLEALPGVVQALVVPVADAEYGQRPVAFVRGPAAAGGQRLARELERHLARFMIPEAFYTWPDTGTEPMKVDRSAFRRLAEERRLERK